MDDICDTSRVMAARNGFVIYAGWLHSSTSHISDCRGSDPRDPRAATNRLSQYRGDKFAGRGGRRGQ